MKRSNQLLLALVVITILVQVLLVYGYKESYQQELINQTVVHPFGDKFPKGPFKALVTDRVALWLYQHPTQQGYNTRFSSLEDMKQVEFRAQNDTLYITNLKRTQNADFRVMLHHIPTIICRNTHLTLNHLRTDSVQVYARSLSWVQVKNCQIKYLQATLRDKASLNMFEKTNIGVLSLSLYDESNVTQTNTTLSKVNLRHVSDKTEVKLTGAGFKAVQ